MLLREEKGEERKRQAPKEETMVCATEDFVSAVASTKVVGVQEKGADLGQSALITLRTHLK